MQNKLNSFLIIILLVLIIWPSSMTAQEIQVPVCDKIQQITPQMAAGLDFFAAYPGFQQATVYKTPDSTLMMDILYKIDGSTLRERKPVTNDEINLICAQLSSNVTEEINNEVDVDRDGRRKIIASTMAYSLAYYAWAIPLSFNAESGKAYTASYLLIGSAGYFVPMLATQKGSYTNGMSKGYTYGCFLGIGHGLSLGALLSGGYDHNFVLGASAVVSVGEGIAGLNYARKHNLNRAHMRTMGSMGTWGLAYGFGIPAIWESEEDLEYAGSSLAVSALGIVLGDHYAKKFKPADGDVTVINGMGVLGGAVATTLVYTFAGEDGSPAAYVGGIILGSLTGLSMGFAKTSKVNYTRTDGNLIILGEVAGGLIGGGLAAIVEAEPTAAFWMISAGLFGGFLISDSMVLKRKRDTNITGMNLSFDINPVACQNLITKTSLQPQPGRPLLNSDLAKITLHL